MLHVVSRFEQADEIAAGMDTAETVTEAERWDAAFFRLPERIRRAWLEREAAELGMDPDEYQLATPELRLL